MITASVFGLVTGLWLSAMPPALISLLGIRGNIIIIIIINIIIIIVLLSGLGTGFGLLTLTRGLAAMSGPPLAGLVVDR